MLVYIVTSPKILTKIIHNDISAKGKLLLSLIRLVKQQYYQIYLKCSNLVLSVPVNNQTNIVIFFIQVYK